jgi:cytochrome b involved in lipid metabolism
MSKQFTANEVKEAGSVEKGLHIIIDNDVYEMGGFVEEHPGGAKILKRVGGKDASKQFWKVSGARTLYGMDMSKLGHHENKVLVRSAAPTRSRHCGVWVRCGKTLPCTRKSGFILDWPWVVA